MKLSILIPTLPQRKILFGELVGDLFMQRQSHKRRIQIQILYNDDAFMTIGAKRNFLLQGAAGEYISFIDDDDGISKNYIDLLMEGIEKDVDCCSLKGVYTVNGKNPKEFWHYLECETYYETLEAYHRYPNHLNCIRASIAKQFKFPEINHGEDTDWATQIKKSGLLKTEHKIDQIIYYYDKRI